MICASSSTPVGSLTLVGSSLASMTPLLGSSLRPVWSAEATLLRPIRPVCPPPDKGGVALLTPRIAKMSGVLTRRDTALFLLVGAATVVAGVLRYTSAGTVAPFVASAVALALLAVLVGHAV